MDDLFERYKPRHPVDLNVVPILDMLVSVIFFLLLSTSFIGYTKQQIPPSAVSTVSSPQVPPPLSPKMVAGVDKGQLSFRLVWSGTRPGSTRESINWKEALSDPKLIKQKIEALLKSFSAKYPEEKSIQVALAPDVPYQVLISMMDACMNTLPNVILFSYYEAQEMLKDNNVF